MKNEFNQEKLRELFCFNQQLCWKCGKNHADCFHHILKRVSNSFLNAAPLNNELCHLNDGKIHSEETRRKYLLQTYRFLVDNRYQFTEKDWQFIKENKKYYQFIDSADNLG